MITTVFLALATAATQSYTIKFKVPAAGRQAPAEEALDDDSNGLQFVDVPVVWPLAVSGTVGLLLWFLPSAVSSSPAPRKRGRRRRKR